MAIINNKLKKYLHKDLQTVVDLIHRYVNSTTRLSIDFGDRNQTNTQVGSVTKFRFGKNNIDGKGKVGFGNKTILQKVQAVVLRNSRFPSTVVLLDDSTFIYDEPKKTETIEVVQPEKEETKVVNPIVTEKGDELRKDAVKPAKTL